jgi:hypothetical protein
MPILPTPPGGKSGIFGHTRAIRSSLDLPPNFRAVDAPNPIAKIPP